MSLEKQNINFDDLISKLHTELVMEKRIYDNISEDDVVSKDYTLKKIEELEKKISDFVLNHYKEISGLKTEMNKRFDKIEDRLDKVEMSSNVMMEQNKNLLDNYQKVNAKVDIIDSFQKLSLKEVEDEINKNAKKISQYAQDVKKIKVNPDINKSKIKEFSVIIFIFLMAIGSILLLLGMSG